MPCLLNRAKDTLKTALGRNYVVALNLAPSVPLWLSNLGGKAMSLGLDLHSSLLLLSSTTKSLNSELIIFNALSFESAVLRRITIRSSSFLRLLYP
jgi:hypothetical protein